MAQLTQKRARQGELPNGTYQKPRSHEVFREGGRSGTTEEFHTFASVPPNVKTTFSQFLYDDGCEDSKVLLGGNSFNDGQAMYNEGKEIFWMSYAEQVFKNVEILQTDIARYAAGPDADIFAIFPIIRSAKTHFQSSQFISEPTMPEISTRKVPNRNISMKVAIKRHTAQYTGEGFQVDYEAMKTREGMQYFDRMLGQLVSDLWNAIITSAIHEFQMEPCGYNRPVQLYPFTGIPRSVSEVQEIEAASTFGMLNKGTQAITRLIAYANGIFRRDNLKLGSFVLTMQDSDWVNIGGDDSQKWYDQSGSAALANRSSGNSKRPIHGITQVSVPTLDLPLHSPNHDYQLRHDVTLGSKAHFCDPMHRADPTKYESSSRTVKFPSWTSNKHDEYDFKNFLNHCMQFNPLQSDVSTSEGDRKDEGKINRRLMNELARRVEQLFRESKTELANNEDVVDVLLGYDAGMNRDETDLNRCAWYPINAFGEMSEKMIKSRHLLPMYKNWEAVLFAGCTNEDKMVWSKALELARFLAKPTEEMSLSVNQSSAKATMAGDLSEPQYSEFAVNSHGGIDLDNLFALNKNAGDRKTAVVPWGYGNYAGFATVAEYVEKHLDHHNILPEIADVIVPFVPLYQRVIKRAMEVTSHNAALDPNMCPAMHQPESLDEMTKVLNAAWPFLFDAFNEPYYGRFDGGSDRTVTIEASSTAAPYSEKPVPGDAGELGLLSADLMVRGEDKRARVMNMEELRTIVDPDKYTKLKKSIDYINQKASKGALSDDDVVRYNDRLNEQMGFKALDWIAFFKALQARIEDIRVFAAMRTSMPGDSPVDTNFEAMDRAVHSAAVMNLNENRPILLPLNIVDPTNIQPIPRYVKGEDGARLDGDQIGRTIDNFYVSERGLFSSTPITRMQYIKEQYKPAPRGRVGPNGEVRTLLYADGLPYVNQLATDEEALRRELIHNEAAFEVLRSQFPELPDLVIHNMIHPFSGYNAAKMTPFECRWLEANKLPATAAFAAKLLLMQTICLKATDKLYDNNMCIPLNGMIIRPWEQQLMASLVAIADGDLGITSFSGIDNTVGFDQFSQTFSIQAFMHFKVLIKNNKRFLMLPFVRGGPILGGKGNQYANHLPGTGAVYPTSNYWQEIVQNRLFNGELLGDYSNFAVLQGYNTAAEDTFGESHYDIRGAYHANDYLGRLEESTDFGWRSRPMYDGQFFTAMNLNLDARRKRELPGVGEFTFADQAESRAINFVVDQVTQFVRTKDNKMWQKIHSAHMWGDENEGLTQVEQSITPNKIPAF